MTLMQHIGPNWFFKRMKPRYLGRHKRILPYEGGTRPPSTINKVKQKRIYLYRFARIATREPVTKNNSEIEHCKKQKSQYVYVARTLHANGTMISNSVKHRKANTSESQSLSHFFCFRIFNLMAMALKTISEPNATSILRTIGTIGLYAMK